MKTLYIPREGTLVEVIEIAGNCTAKTNHGMEILNFLCHNVDKRWQQGCTIRRSFELRILEINAISSGKKVQIKISVLFNVL